MEQRCLWTEVNRVSRLRVGVIFGGRSGEHEVSLMSARSIMDTLRKAGFEVVPIGISKTGKWLLANNPLALPEETLADGSLPVAMLPEPGNEGLVRLNGALCGKPAVAPVDVVFPAMHGTYGEDGSLQGLLEMADVPYVGAGVLGSAVGMDKDVQKRLFREAGIPVLDFWMVPRVRYEHAPDAVMDEIERRIGYPCFVKPCNLGSSVGVNKAEDRDKLRVALNDAALYDRKILIERAAVGYREIEVSVLGNDEPKASLPGEILPAREFYDYTAKYIDERSRTEVPARLTADVTRRVQELGVECFKVLDCAGMARVDFFVSMDGQHIVVNELNTIPGFTRISMYPKMWEASGLPYPELLKQLVCLAIDRYQDKNRRLTHYTPPALD